MNEHMPGARLNEAERNVQQPFMKLVFFNSLIVGLVVLAAARPIVRSPEIPSRQPARAALTYRPVDLPPAPAPFHLGGAWHMTAADKRFGGISALAIDHGRFLAMTDRGAYIRFDPPSAARPLADLADLRKGPGKWGVKRWRDAESLARDPRGRGWWVGFEQRHSLWLYDDGFSRVRAAINLHRPDWYSNRGAEGLLSEADSLLVVAENGREAMRIGKSGIARLGLRGGPDIAEAARAPDGSAWVILRQKGLDGIAQSLAPLLPDRNGYRLGRAWPLPKAPFDNFEGMAIEAKAGGGWRIWLATDDGHRFMARTLLVALDLPDPARAMDDKRPATSARRLKMPAVKTP